MRLIPPPPPPRPACKLHIGQVFGTHFACIVFENVIIRIQQNISQCYCFQVSLH